MFARLAWRADYGITRIVDLAVVEASDECCERTLGEWLNIEEFDADSSTTFGVQRTVSERAAHNDGVCVTWRLKFDNEGVQRVGGVVDEFEAGSVH